MEINKETALDGGNNHSNQADEKPNAWKVDDEDNLREDNLDKDLYGNARNNMKPVMEGEGTGGENFGENNNTPAANDKNNPSQYAGNSNAYFDRTAPSEEHPEDSNFKNANQDGQPEYSKAQANSTVNNEMPKPEKVERGNGENDRPHKGDTYQEGTADNENEPNIPGPNELPDQQKVGENTKAEGQENEHIEN